MKDRRRTYRSRKTIPEAARLRAARPPRTGAAPFDALPSLLSEGVSELIQLVQENDISEILVQRGRSKIHIRRGAGGTATADHAGAPLGAAKPSGVAGTSEDVIVFSPMVGRFYRSASPKAPPFVEVGQYVTKGQKLCIVEAMKIMNELHAELDGEILEILAENGQAVEYGQHLFRLRTVDRPPAPDAVPRE